MDQVQARKQLEDNTIIPVFGETMEQLEVILQQEKDEFRRRFVKEFSDACRKHQRENPERKTRILMFQFLRTDLLEKKYKYRIVCYDRDWYLGKGDICGEIDTGMIFHFYHVMEDRLIREARTYVGKISTPWIQHQMGKLRGLFQVYVKELILYSLGEATEDGYYRELKKEGDFQIRLGELLEPGELIYQEQEKKDRKKILRWISEHKKETYCFQDWRGMDMKGLELNGHDFRYTDFRESNLESSSLNLCLMNGARFRNCQMQTCCMAGSMVHDVDFSGSDMREADLRGILSCTGKDIRSGWKATGYVGGSFQNVDLRGASLEESVCCGIDFAGARLEGTKFTGASLYRSRFTREQLMKADLTKEQLQQIEVMN